MKSHAKTLTTYETCCMKRPKHILPIHTPIAENWVDENGIVCSISNDRENTIEAFMAHFDTLDRALQHKKAPFLVDPTLAGPLSVKDRKILHERLLKTMSCGAFISKNAIVNLGVNIFFKMRKSPIPIKMFKDEAKAREWLAETMKELESARTN